MTCFRASRLCADRHWISADPHLDAFAHEAVDWIEPSPLCQVLSVKEKRGKGKGFHDPRYQIQVFDMVLTNPCLLGRGDALMLVDLQNDFLAGGTLAVAGAEAVLPAVVTCLRVADVVGLPVFASADWHPSDHCSFRAQGGPWPPHCIAGTHGAAFAESLGIEDVASIVRKGQEKDKEAYSAFEGTDLAERLKNFGVSRLIVAGLATDYCVLHTVLDALDKGLNVILVSDAMRAVNPLGSGEEAMREMRKAGAESITSADLVTERQV